MNFLRLYTGIGFLVVIGIFLSIGYSIIFYPLILKELWLEILVGTLVLFGAGRLIGEGFYYEIDE